MNTALHYNNMSSTPQCKTVYKHQHVHWIVHKLRNKVTNGIRSG